MTVLVFGKTGQVATELASGGNVVCLGRGQADLGDPASCAAAILDRRPQAVINAAAYTAVDRAESEEALAHVVNGDAPAAMAAACAGQGIPFVHISTDYVFDGSGVGPRDETAGTGPLGVYGASKLAGEDAVRSAGGVYAILRTSWVFSAHGANFLKTMLRLGNERSTLNVVADQIGGPTPAGAIADTCLKIAAELQRADHLGGVYHFSGAPDASWADFAREIFQAAELDVAVSDIGTADYPTPARRPLNSRLDCGAIDAVFGIKRPDWRAHVAEIITQLKGSGT